MLADFSKPGSLLSSVCVLSHYRFVSWLFYVAHCLKNPLLPLTSAKYRYWWWLHLSMPSCLLLFPEAKELAVKLECSANFPPHWHPWFSVNMGFWCFETAWRHGFTQRYQRCWEAKVKLSFISLFFCGFSCPFKIIGSTNQAIGLRHYRKIENDIEHFQLHVGCYVFTHIWWFVCLSVSRITHKTSWLVHKTLTDLLNITKTKFSLHWPWQMYALETALLVYWFVDQMFSKLI